MMKSEKEFPSILVLVAAKNEEEGIEFTLSELNKHLKGSRFLVVDGDSRDQTVHKAKSLGAEVIFQKGKGKGNAIGCALDYLEDVFDYVVLIDGDYTYPAEHIPQMIEVLEKNPQVGMVCGNRFNHNLHLDVMNNMLIFGNRVIAFIHNLVNGVNLRDPLSGLRVIRGELIKNWQPRSAGFDIEVELNHYIKRRGYRIAEVEIVYRERVGEKKLRVKDGLTILRRIIVESI